MIVTLQSQRLQTMEQVRAFLEGSEPVDYRHWDRSSAYAFVRQTLVRFRYETLGRRDRGAVLRFLAFSENVRRAVYTTNQIESPDSSLRRAVCRRGHFPGDDSARKLLYLALRDIEARWKGPPAYWPEASREFAIQFGERFRILD